MAAKIQLNFGKIGTFGWIFSTIDAFRKARLSNLIDNTLGDKWINTKYTYSYKKAFGYFHDIAQINPRPFTSRTETATLR